MKISDSGRKQIACAKVTDIAVLFWKQKAI